MTMTRTSCVRSMVVEGDVVLLYMCRVSREQSM